MLTTRPPKKYNRVEDTGKYRVQPSSHVQIVISYCELCEEKDQEKETVHNTEQKEIQSKIKCE